jgi:hypothetical protein
MTAEPAATMAPVVATICLSGHGSRINPAMENDDG